MPRNGIIIRPDARELIRTMRPVVWLVLQDVAIDADLHTDVLRAPTSARRVAAHLGIEPGTAASALRVLRERRFLDLRQASESDGRFGLATYTVSLPAGVELFPAGRTIAPAHPCVASPDTVGPHTVERITGPGTPPRNEVTRPAGTRRSTAPRVEQGRLDLGGVDR
jgi:hypothetical protein